MVHYEFRCCNELQLYSEFGLKENLMEILCVKQCVIMEQIELSFIKP